MMGILRRNITRGSSFVDYSGRLRHATYAGNVSKDDNVNHNSSRQ
jgi:hypothetical protein